MRLKVDVIVTGAGRPTRAAKDATRTIPIVMAQDNDPVGDGFIASLARPGGNITGLTTLHPEVSGKRLEILKEVVPNMSRAALLGTSTSPGYGQVQRDIELAAKAFGVNLENHNVLESKDIEIAFRAASKGRADALLTLPSGVLFSHRSKIIALAIRIDSPRSTMTANMSKTRAHELQREFYRLASPRGNLRGQDLKRSQARRSASRATDQIRVASQSQSRTTNRPHDSTECAGESGSGD